jgi:hypothetical protein
MQQQEQQHQNSRVIIIYFFLIRFRQLQKTRYWSINDSNSWRLHNPSLIHYPTLCISRLVSTDSLAVFRIPYGNVMHIFICMLTYI